MAKIKTCSFAEAQRAYDNMSPPEDDYPECPDCGGIMENNKRYEQLECINDECGRVIDYSHPDS